MSQEQKHSRRLSAGSWAAILYGGGVFVLLAVIQVVIWTLPTDGWSYEAGRRRPGEVLRRTPD